MTRVHGKLDDIGKNKTKFLDQKSFELMVNFLFSGTILCFCLPFNVSTWNEFMNKTFFLLWKASCKHMNLMLIERGKKNFSYTIIIIILILSGKVIFSVLCLEKHIKMDFVKNKMTKKKVFLVTKLSSDYF